MNQRKLFNIIWYGIVAVTGCAMMIHEVWHKSPIVFVCLAGAIAGLGAVRLGQTIRE